MNRNYRSSLHKWNAGLWNRLSRRFEKDSYTRSYIWTILLWNPCGFCIKFPLCRSNKCPLRQDGHCTSAWKEVPENSLLRVMRTAWEDNDREAFEKARLKFYNILKSYRDRFEEEQT